MAGGYIPPKADLFYSSLYFPKSVQKLLGHASCMLMTHAGSSTPDTLDCQDPPVESGLLIFVGIPPNANRPQ